MKIHACPGYPTTTLKNGGSIRTGPSRDRDWKCEYCGSLQPGILYRCDNCYAPRFDEGEEPKLSRIGVADVAAAVTAVEAYQQFARDFRKRGLR